MSESVGGSMMPRPVKPPAPPPAPTAAPLSKQAQQTESPWKPITETPVQASLPSPAAPVGSQEGVGDENDATMYLTEEEQDLAVLMEEWRQVAGHRKFEWDQLAARACPSLARLIQQVKQSDPVLYAEDPIKTLVRPTAKPYFVDMRRQLRSKLSHIQRRQEPMTPEERKNAVVGMKVSANPTVRRVQPSPSRKRPPGGKPPGRPRKRKVSGEAELDEYDDRIPSIEDDFGLREEEEELAWLLEAWKLHHNRKRGMWEFIEKEASPALRTRFAENKDKKWFREVPLNFLVKQSRLPNFRRYRDVVRREMKKDPRIAGASPALVTEQGRPTSRSPTPEQDEELGMLPEEYMELADLTMKYDGGQNGVWFDIYRHASPHLQILLRKEAPRTGDAPPESLVPTTLRPAFRAYCSSTENAPLLRRRVCFAHSQQETAGSTAVVAAATATAAGAVAAATAAATATAAMPPPMTLNRAATENDMREYVRRKKSRLDMLCTRMERSLGDFKHQELTLLDATVAQGDPAWQQQKIMLIRLFQDLDDEVATFRETEESTLQQDWRHFRKSQQRLPSDFEAMLRNAGEKQQSRINVLLNKIHRKLTSVSGGGPR